MRRVWRSGGQVKAFMMRRKSRAGRRMFGWSNKELVVHHLDEQVLTPWNSRDFDHNNGTVKWGAVNDSLYRSASENDPEGRGYRWSAG
jgi:hypothetical protein